MQGRITLSIALLLVCIGLGEGMRGEGLMGPLYAIEACWYLCCCFQPTHIPHTSSSADKAYGLEHAQTIPYVCCTTAGLGLPNRELFQDDSKPLVPQKAAAAVSQRNSRVLRLTRTSTNSAATNETGLTMSGLKEELSGIKDRVKDTEHRHSKATIAVAATLGSLLLVTAVGCAGMLICRRFVTSQHCQRKGRNDRAQHYDVDRLLGDPAGL